MAYQTIRLSVEVKKELDGLKPHPRATYEEVVRMLLDFYQEKKPK